MVSTPTFSLYQLEDPLTRAEVLAEFASMPDRLASAIAGAPAGALERAPAPGQWSALQVVSHLRDAALVYGARFRWIVLNDDPFLANFDEDRWVDESRETPADIPALLETIAASRRDIARLLGRMRDVEWQRTGRHEVIGTVVLEDYVRHEVVHERGHLEQLANALRG
jgi:hypothetical protein